MRLCVLNSKKFFLNQLLSFLTILMIAAGATGAMAAPPVVNTGYVTTGQTGAQTQIDMFHSSKFTITPTAATTILGGNFTMKNGSSTVAAGHKVEFILWNSTRTVKLGSVLYTAEEFCTAHGGNCGTFAPTLFTFSSPVSLVAGQTYYAELTSPDAEDRQSEAYFIKGGKTCSILNGKQSVATASCAGGFVPPGGLPTLKVAKSTTQTTAAPGELITYTISVTNSGPGAASSATINDLIPAGTSFDSATGTNWACDSAPDSILTCSYTGSIGTTAPNNAADALTVKVKVEGASTVENWVTVDPTGDNNPILPGPDNCTAEDITAGACAKSQPTEINASGPYLDITLSDPAPPLTPGGNSTYTVTVENNGDAATTIPVHAYVELPAGATFVCAPDPAGFSKQQMNEMSLTDVLKKAGYKCVRPPTNDPEKRIQAVERLLNQQLEGKAMYIIDPSCEQLIRGFRYGYRYKIKKNGELEDRPDKNSFSHVHDANQYADSVIDMNVRGVPLQSARREVKKVARVY